MGQKGFGNRLIGIMRQEVLRHLWKLFCIRKRSNLSCFLPGTLTISLYAPKYWFYSRGSISSGRSDGYDTSDGVQHISENYTGTMTTLSHH